MSVVNVTATRLDGNLTVVDTNLQMMADENKDSSVEPAYHNPHYFESQNLLRENPVQSYEEVTLSRSNGDTVASDYQSLSTTTMDYISLYSRPGEGRERDIVPKVEVGGKFYAVVNKDKTEQHIYTSLAK